MLIALVVMAGVLILTMVFNNRRRPARWEGGSGGDVSTWAYGGGDGGDSGMTVAVMPGVGTAAAAMVAAAEGGKLADAVSNSYRGSWE